MKKRLLSCAASLTVTVLAGVSPVTYAAEPYAERFTDCIKLEDTEWLSAVSGKCEAVYMKPSDDHGATFYFIERYPDTVSFSVSSDVDEARLENLITETDKGLILLCYKNNDNYDCTVTFKNDKGEYDKIDSKTAKALYEALKVYASAFEYRYDQYIYSYSVYDYLTGYEAMEYSFPIEDKLNEYLKSNDVKASLLKYSSGEETLLGNESVGETFFVVPDEEITFTEHYSLAKSIAEETGLRPHGVSPTGTGGKVEGMTINADDYIKGDANCDGTVDMSDAVLIMQSIANPDRYKLTAQGSFNADTDGDGITSGDALAIQKKLLKLEE